MAAKAPAKPAPAKKEEEEDSSSEEDDDEDDSSSASGSEASGPEPSRLDELKLTKDQIVLLQNAFTAFDSEKKGCLGMEMIGTILELLGHAQTQTDLEKIIKEVDEDGSGELEFEEFCVLAAKFLVEEEEDTGGNTELLTSELKETFRYYDKDGKGYITTDDFKDILKELDPEISEKDLVGMVNEIDQDDSGTVDFEEFVKALR